MRPRVAVDSDNGSFSDCRRQIEKFLQLKFIFRCDFLAAGTLILGRRFHCGFDVMNERLNL